MSLILDALNKADREREPAPAVPSITHPYVGSGPAAQAALPSWVFALVGALAVSVVVMLVLLFKLTGNSASYPQEAPQQEVPQQELPQTERVKPAPEANANRELHAVSQEQPFGQYPVAGEVNAVKPEPTQVAAPRDPEPVAADAVAHLYGQGVQAAPNKVRQSEPAERAAASAVKLPAPKTDPLVDDAELAALWREAQQETAPPAVPAANTDGYGQLPYLYQLPESFQERIPTLMYQNHIYTARASAVIINGATYKVGDRLAEQLKVEAITEEDLVLSYMDKPFKLAALSSWVKMN